MRLPELVLHDTPLRVFYEDHTITVEFSHRRLVKHFIDTGSTVLEGNYYSWSRAELAYGVAVMDALPSYLQKHSQEIRRARIVDLEELVHQLEQDHECRKNDLANHIVAVTKFRAKEQEKIAAHKDTLAQLRAALEPA